MNSAPVHRGDQAAPVGQGVPQMPDVAERVFHRLPVGVIVFDKELRVVSHNQAAAFLLRPGKLVWEMLENAAVEARYENWAVALGKVLQTGQTARFDSITCRGAGGQDLLINVTCAPLTREESRQVFGGMLVLEDVTLQASMEKRLAVSERLAAVGKLAARVAHELNNPLDGILRYINLALRVTTKTNDEQVSRYLIESRKGLLRMTQIVRDLLQFSRASPVDYEQTTVNQLVEDAVKALSNEATQGEVTVIMSLGAGMPPLHAGNLFQVFCNLIKNAIDAMANGGTLTISTTVTSQHVNIRVEDTGTGLPENRDRIFEPFFTTKAPGKGTGLGLAVCRDIVERYNGQLTAANRPEGGAVFEVRIPLSSCAGGEAGRSAAPVSGR
ncbi:MAG: GHKL domain-containing protein [Phycisphaerae bacterium]|nr:GHKL domain-containing protein [Phycisphaerae bacterium]